MQYSSQQVLSVISTTHLAHLPLSSLHQPSVCSLPLRVSHGLLPSPFPPFHIFIYFLFVFNVYYLFLRETESKWGRGRETGRERIPSSLCTVSTEPDAGLEPMTHDIMTWAEIKSWMLDQLSRPGTPHLFCLLNSTYEWNPVVFVFLQLISLSIIYSSYIHVVANGKIAFFLKAKNIPLHTYTTSSVPIHESISLKNSKLFHCHVSWKIM